MILGFISNVCGYSAAKYALKGVIKSSGMQMVDKVIVPAGVEIFAFMAGDEAQKYVEGRINEVKEAYEAIKAVREEVKKGEEKPEQHNIFDDFEEVDENGECGNA